ncbi:Smad nuclear-interacting protein 1 [Exaiptasia diaphana]|nr:Smad nuclear-interacting protein 1 [Exaiptasia diaphana]
MQKPYIIDLESANGTYLNNERIEPRRYYELKERDVLKFGFSSREYVMLHERSLNTEENQEEPTSSNEDSPE